MSQNGQIHFKNLTALSKKSGWAGADRNVFMSKFFADDLDFGAALEAKLK